MKTVFGEDWAEKIRIIFAGDDVTDEDAMSALKGVAHSFRYVCKSWEGFSLKSYSINNRAFVNQKLMASISDFGQNSAKVGGQLPPPLPPCG